MDRLLPPIPASSDLVLNSKMERIWLDWFRELILKVGKGASDPIADLDALISERIDMLDAELTGEISLLSSGIVSVSNSVSDVSSNLGDVSSTLETLLPPYSSVYDSNYYPTMGNTSNIEYNTYISNAESYIDDLVYVSVDDGVKVTRDEASKTIVANEAISNNDSTIIADASSSSIVITLPLAKTCLGKKYQIIAYNIVALTTITINTQGGEQIRSVATDVITSIMWGIGVIGSRITIQSSIDSSGTVYWQTIG